MATFKAVVIEKTEAGPKTGLADFDERDLMEGDVTVRVARLHGDAWRHRPVACGHQDGESRDEMEGRMPGQAPDTPPHHASGVAGRRRTVLLRSRADRVSPLHPALARAKVPLRRMRHV